MSLTLSARSPNASKCCSHIKFPDRQPCNVPLMKRVRTSAGSIISCLKDFLIRPGFVENTGILTLSDIYDGKIWKDFLNPSGVPFLSVPDGQYRLAGA